MLYDRIDDHLRHEARAGMVEMDDAARTGNIGSQSGKIWHSLPNQMKS
jgi:hypothetical protein